MKVRAIALCFVFAVVSFAAYADSSTTGSPESTSSNYTGFGLQPTIFNNVRLASTNLQNNISNLTSYTPTPGDLYTLTVDTGSTSLVGASTAVSYPVPLNDNMTMDIPYIGTINVAGMNIPEISQKVVTAIKKAIPVVFASFVLTRPAEFNVFVYGGVNSPGYVVANSLVTVIDAIAMAKGFATGASYRHIDLIRGGKTIVVDLQKYYLDAEMKANPTLRPGDKIFVPEAQIIDTITGQVHYPGTYELLPSETLATLIRLAGGTTPTALTSRINVTRTNSNGTHELVVTSMADASTFKMQNADQVQIFSASENSNMVTIEGAIFGKPRSGEGPVNVPQGPVRVDFPYYPGISLLSLLDSVGGPTPNALTGDGYILQASNGKRIPVAIEKLWRTRNPGLDVTLQPGDKVVIPIQIQQVFVTGEVVRPGPQGYQADATVNDYLLMAGGVIENIGNPNGVYLVAPDGAKTKLSPNERVLPGSHIYVAMSGLFKTNQSVQNFLLTTGWVAAIVAFATAVWNFMVLVGVL